MLGPPKALESPLYDRQWTFLFKNGSDKRKINSPEELLRIFQEGGMVRADTQLGRDSNLDDLDHEYFDQYFFKVYDKKVEETGLPVNQILKNMKLAEDDQPKIN